MVNPTKESQGAKAGGKVCLYSGPTQLSSTVIMSYRAVLVDAFYLYHRMQPQIIIAKHVSQDSNLG